MPLTLRPLREEDGRDIYDMLQEIPADENGFVNPMHGAAYADYRAWLAQAQADALKTGIEDGWRVPQSTYWLFADSTPVGIIKLRHFLTDKLREEGGHIGYAIRPSQRGRGYGRAMLRLLLPHARDLGIDRALITVQNGNEPSVRVALACGGRIERVSDTRQYIWIDC